jgi:hypothetical protein
LVSGENLSQDAGYFSRILTWEETGERFPVDQGSASESAHCPKTPLLISSYWGLGFQHWNFGRHNFSTLQVEKDVFLNMKKDHC